jgi:hypothetical protein
LYHLSKIPGKKRTTLHTLNYPGNNLQDGALFRQNPLQTPDAGGSDDFGAECAVYMMRKAGFRLVSNAFS